MSSKHRIQSNLTSKEKPICHPQQKTEKQKQKQTFKNKN